MKMVRFTFCLFLAAFVWVAGCTTPKHISNPLEGFKSCPAGHLDKMITDDYRNYIRLLPPQEKNYVQWSDIWFYENEAGQHAVRIEIALDRVTREHVLIYDKADKRVKVIKYINGRYSS